MRFSSGYRCSTILSVILAGASACSTSESGPGQLPSNAPSSDAAVRSGDAMVTDAAGQPAAGGSGRAGASGATHEGNDALPECVQPLSESDCPVTLGEVLAAWDCSGQPRGSMQRLTQCGARRIVSMDFIGAGQTCSYDLAGALVGASSCARAIGGCACFVAGETVPGSCALQNGVDACGADAGLRDE